MAIIRSKGNNADPTPGNVRLEAFYPVAPEAAPIPQPVPSDIQREFREAELCAAANAYRAAAALLRSTLEKTLKANGYTKRDGSLQQRIEAAATDGIITVPRKEKAHSEIRILANDVLHDDYRIVEPEEVKSAPHYTQRTLEDLYDDRPTVEKILQSKNRISPSAQAVPQPAP